MPIFYVSNVDSHISEEERVVLKQWMKPKKDKNSIQKNLFAHHVVQLKLVTAKSMEKNFFHSNANFVVRLLNGCVGEILISPTNAIKNKLQDSMFLDYPKISCLSACSAKLRRTD